MSKNKVTVKKEVKITRYADDAYWRKGKIVAKKWFTSPSSPKPKGKENWEEKFLAWFPSGYPLERQLVQDFIKSLLLTERKRIIKKIETELIVEHRDRAFNGAYVGDYIMLVIAPRDWDALKKKLNPSP